MPKWGKVILVVLAFVLLTNVVSLVISLESDSHTNNNTHRLETLVHEQEESTRNRVLISCQESNERHEKAEGFVAQLVEKSPNKPQTKEQKKVQAEEIELFVDAIAPSYTPKQCSERVEKFTHP